MHTPSRIFAWALSLGLAASPLVAQDAPSAPRAFGGRYAELTPAQQRLVEDWVERFRDLTGQEIETDVFYDDFVRLSTKTTFQAVTHALLTTPLTSASGESLGSALDLIERVEAVHGKIKGASGDEQFRIYVLLKPDAIATLERSVEFERGPDNTVFHKGYPLNYRQQGGAPSMQISVARNERRADVDVDYRSSSFPAALLNGHLSSANSDVRAGNNYDRHNDRWAGFRNWWRGFFGLTLSSDYEDVVANKSIGIPAVPRAGKQTVDKMMYDFLHAWLVEGDVAAAMGYVSRKAYTCVAVSQGLDSEDFDLGMAPYRILLGMRAVRDALGPKESLDDVTVGVRVVEPGFKVVQQPHHARFVLYAVPDDVARSIDCADPSTMKLEPRRRRDALYGEAFVALFHILGPRGSGETVALLWAKEDDYWKIVAYEVEPEDEPEIAGDHVAPAADIARVPLEPDFARAVDSFLDAWLIEKDYDRAFSAFSPPCYACYNLFREEGRPEARSDEEAGRFLREGLGRLGELVGPIARLDEALEPAVPTNPVVKVMDHPRADTYTLVSFPRGVIELADCARRARGGSAPGLTAEGYGEALGAYFRFRAEGGESPVFRVLWTREDGAWKIRAYDIELP